MLFQILPDPALPIQLIFIYSTTGSHSIPAAHERKTLLWTKIFGSFSGVFFRSGVLIIFSIWPD